MTEKSSRGNMNRALTVSLVPSFLAGFILFPKLGFLGISPLVYPHGFDLPGVSLLKLRLERLPPLPGEGGQAAECLGLRPPHRPAILPPSIIARHHSGNLNTLFVYFHNVVSCPYSIENIFPHFRVLVTQFIAIYSTKADSNSTGERKKKSYQPTTVSVRWKSKW